jgi:hypothetical protein
MNRPFEWQEARKLTNRVRECMRDDSPLRKQVGDSKMPEAVGIVIEREFDVEYTPEEITAIDSGRGVPERKR